MSEAAKKLVSRPQAAEGPDLDALADGMREYAMLKKQIEFLTQKQTAVKTRLSGIVEQYGEADDKGHLRIRLVEPVEGYKWVVRQRRVSVGYDEEKAKEIIHDAGLDERCFEMIPVLNEDEVRAAHYEGLLSQADLDEIFPPKVTWAFAPTKD